MERDGRPGVQCERGGGRPGGDDENRDRAAAGAFRRCDRRPQPGHFDEAYAATTRFGGRIAHGLLVGGVISSLLANELPGPGTVYLSQEFSFRAPVRIGDEVRCEVEVTDAGERGRVTLATRAWVGETLVVDGVARVLAPG